MSTSRRFSWALAVLVLSFPAAAQTTFWVDCATGLASAPCGTQASPCKSIYVAATQTTPGGGDTIRVRPGQCVECLPLFFCVTDDLGNCIGDEVNGFTVVADDWLVNQRNTTTIIGADGDCIPIAALNLVHPLPAVLLGDDTVLQGFTIKGGRDSGIAAFGRNDILNNVIDGNTTATQGGGIYMESTLSITEADVKSSIKGNTIRNNTAALDGGGLFLFGFGSGVVSEVEIDGNVFQSNTVSGTQVLGGRGGGLAIETATAGATDVSTVVVKGNVIEGNRADNSADGNDPGLGGGVYATTGLQGPGAEEIRIGDDSAAFPSNAIRTNTAGFQGGGVYAEIDAVAADDGSDWRIEVAKNTVSNNVAAYSGGGIEVFQFATEVTTGTKLRIEVDDNEVTGNRTTTAPTVDLDFPRGGGVAALSGSWRTPESEDIGVSIERNKIRSNTTAGYGGGVGLFAWADDDPNATGTYVDATATLRFRNNLVAQNTAANADDSAAGGGIYAYAQARGDKATAATDLEFLTVATNATELGAGGIELEWLIGTNGGGAGATTFDVSNSIFQANETYGVGSLATPSGTASVAITYNDAFGNEIAAYEASLAAIAQAGPGNISSNPLLNASFVPSVCSPTVDAADPAEPATAETQPNGGRANMGHLGATESAVRTFPDTDGSGKIDGVDILNVAISFSSTSAQPARFNPGADRDLDDDVDGDDLSYVTAFFGLSCP